MSNATQLRRSMNALSRLRSDMKYMVPMELYDGMGNVLIRTYDALYQTVRDIANDAFVDALAIDLPESATDRQKAIQVNLLSGQLLAYVEDMVEIADESSGKRPLNEDERTRRRFNDLMDDN